MTYQTRILAYGFAIIFIMTAALGFTSFYSSNTINSSLNLTVSRQLEKINLIHQITTIFYNRTRYIQTILLQENTAENDSSWAQISRLKGLYDESRLRLVPLLSGREMEILNAIDRLDRDISDLNLQVSVLFQNGSQNEARNVLMLEVLPKTVPLLAHLSELTQGQRGDVQKALLLSTHNAEENRDYLVLFASITVCFSVLILISGVLYGRKLALKLDDINSYLEEKILERTEMLLDTQKELLEDNTELTRLALTDNLTGLANRAQMNQNLHKEFSRFERYNKKFGIIILDIDHFKRVNDNYGHDIGDQVLVKLSAQIEQSIRENDSVSRWGGEEFLICCTNIEAEGIFQVAETIRKMIYTYDFGSSGRITASLGCAIIERGENVSELIKRADVALYAAKNNGRNQTVESDFEIIEKFK